jgi:hypothetical protein
MDTLIPVRTNLHVVLAERPRLNYLNDMMTSFMNLAQDNLPNLFGEGGKKMYR